MIRASAVQNPIPTCERDAANRFLTQWIVCVATQAAQPILSSAQQVYLSGVITGFTGCLITFQFSGICLVATPTAFQVFSLLLPCLLYTCIVKCRDLLLTELLYSEFHFPFCLNYVVVAVILGLQTVMLLFASLVFLTLLMLL